jgi:putative PIN family toxin of toxin-antitoxin system
MRVVIDTNLWISGLLWHGRPGEVLRLAEAGELELCIAPSMIEELAQVLAYEKFQPRLQQLRLSPTEILTYAVDLSLVFDLPDPTAVIVTADPTDDVFLRCAVAAGAVYVLSGDHHLLDLKQYMSIPILTVHDFLSREFPS